MRLLLDTHTLLWAIGRLETLPFHHRDPFDRMLTCQAIEHNCVVLTPDPLIVQYHIRTQW